MVTTIDVRFTPTNPTTTQVHVIYTRTALTPEGNDHVTAFTATDKICSERLAAIHRHLPRLAQSLKRAHSSLVVESRIGLLKCVDLHEHGCPIHDAVLSRHGWEARTHLTPCHREQPRDLQWKYGASSTLQAAEINPQISKALFPDLAASRFSCFSVAQRAINDCNCSCFCSRLWRSHPIHRLPHLATALFLSPRAQA